MPRDLSTRFVLTNYRNLSIILLYLPATASRFRPDILLSFLSSDSINLDSWLNSLSFTLTEIFSVRDEAVAITGRNLINPEKN